ncbi:MAG TPA: hypothetical protein VGO47_12230 [Chlamydiales bacterium]|jgi:hypothetical protein|nr:hypothetical protein [Chlamydiales bacterium]
MLIPILRQVLVCGSLLGIGYAFLYCHQEAAVITSFLHEATAKIKLSQQMASNTYFGPIKPAPGNPQLVRLEVLVRDSPEASGLQIVSVEFNNTNIPLKPRDIYGNRGNASFQVKPGTYQLQWIVNRDKFAWPRSVTHEEIVTVSPRDLWLQVSIEGETASIR